jgi:hypothetical protein
VRQIDRAAFVDLDWLRVSAAHGFVVTPAGPDHAPTLDRLIAFTGRDPAAARA